MNTENGTAPGRDPKIDAIVRGVADHFKEELDEIKGELRKDAPEVAAVVKRDWSALGPIGAWLLAAVALVGVLWLGYQAVGTVEAVAEHALAAGQKLAAETVVALLCSLGAVWVLAFAIRNIPWIQRVVMPGHDEMRRIESEFNTLLDQFQEGKMKEPAHDVPAMIGFARALAQRNGWTWIGVTIVFAAVLLVMAPLA